MACVAFGLSGWKDGGAVTDMGMNVVSLGVTQFWTCRVYKMHSGLARRAGKWAVGYMSPEFINDGNTFSCLFPIYVGLVYGPEWELSA